MYESFCFKSDQLFFVTLDFFKLHDYTVWNKTKQYFPYLSRSDSVRAADIKST